MSDHLETELRRALRPVDPGAHFTRDVMARVEASRGAGATPKNESSMFARTLQWLPAALAASLLTAIIVKHDRNEEQTAEGLRAREQLLEALRVTSQKLDLAYQVVHNQADSTAESPEDSGA